MGKTKSREQTFASKPFGVIWEPDNKEGACKARSSTKAGMGVSENMLACLSIAKLRQPGRDEMIEGGPGERGKRQMGL